MIGCRSAFLVLDLLSLIPGHRFCFWDLDCQALGPEFWVLGSTSRVLGPKSWVLRCRCWVFGSGPSDNYYYKVWQVLQNVTVIIKCERKLLKIVTCDKKLLQSVKGITKCDNYYKVRRNSISRTAPFFNLCSTTFSLPKRLQGNINDFG